MDNFSITELCDSDTALRLGIDNHLPPPQVLSNLYVTLGAMEQVRSLLGDKPINVTSGFRCEALERELTRKDYAAWCNRRAVVQGDESWAAYFSGKAHPRGWAVDFKCPAFGTPQQIVRHLMQTDLRFDQCIEEGTWVHIGFDPRMRQKVMTATFAKDGTPSYSEGVTA